MPDASAATITGLNTSLPAGTYGDYTDAISDYSTQFGRSIGYSATATVLCLIIGVKLVGDALSGLSL